MLRTSPISVLVNGASGQLGTALARSLALHQDIFRVTLADREALDITDSAAVKEFIRNYGPFRFIVNCAAYTAVDRAESEPVLCHNINVYGVRNITDAIDGTDTRLIHISTDYVFDGKGDMPYTEDSTINPLNSYGKSKAQSEVVALSSPGTIVIRTGWLFSPFGHNFVRTILGRIQEGVPLKVVDDQIGTPTYAPHLADAIVRIMTNPEPIAEGIYHFANAGLATWYDIAGEILRNVGAKNELNRCKTEELNLPAERPRFSALNASKIKHTLDIEIADWHDALKLCIDELT